MEPTWIPGPGRVPEFYDARIASYYRVLAWKQPFEVIGEELEQEGVENNRATRLTREREAWEEDQDFREWWGEILQDSPFLHLDDELWDAVLQQQGTTLEYPPGWRDDTIDPQVLILRGPDELPWLPRLANMSTKVYRVGVIGYGLSAKIFHIPFVNDVSDFKLYAIVQRSPKPDDDAAKDWPGVKVYRSAEELIADPDVDVVVVTTAPVSHFELAKKAIENGKHVIVEKPFTPTSKEAFELAELAKSKGVLVTVYQNRRWDQDFLTLKKILADGSLGRVVEFNTFFDRHRPEPKAQARWQDVQSPGTGAVYDLGTHLIDQAVALFGIPSSITGFTGRQRKGQGKESSDDSFTAILRYQTDEDEEGELGLTVVAKAAVISCEEKQLRYWVRGEKGSWKKWGLDTQEDQLRQGLRPGAEGYGIEVEPGVLTTSDNQGEISSTRVKGVEPKTYSEFYRKFAAALNGAKDEIPVDATTAAEVIKLVELVRESSYQRRTLDVK
ncbi:hypothetical protein DV738_g3789, partial [Chaetothyriales sp. CBS 135597]